MKSYITTLCTIFLVIGCATSLHSQTDTPNINGLLNKNLQTKSINTTYNSDTDLLVNSFYFLLNTTDKTTSLGAAFTLTKEKNSAKHAFILKPGVILKANDNFALLSNSDDFQEDNIIGQINLSYIFKDTTKLSAGNSAALQSFTMSLNSPALDEDKDDQMQQLFQNENNQTATKAFVNSFVENKMYNSYYSSYITTDLQLPFGHSYYNIAPDASTAPTTEQFYAYAASISAGWIWKWSSGWTVLVAPQLKYFNNNGILVDRLQAVSFETRTAGPNNTEVLLGSKNVYLTDFDSFHTFTTSIEAPVFYTFPHFGAVGLCPYLEVNHGKYDKTNWKLGLGFSLLDKKDNPSVNFELQWKEVQTFDSSNHYIGIATNVLFGKLFE